MTDHIDPGPEPASALPCHVPTQPDNCDACFLVELRECYEPMCSHAAEKIEALHAYATEQQQRAERAEEREAEATMRARGYVQRAERAEAACMRGLHPEALDALHSAEARIATLTEALEAARHSYSDALDQLDQVRRRNGELTEALRAMPDVVRASPCGNDCIGDESVCCCCDALLEAAGALGEVCEACDRGA